MNKYVIMLEDDTDDHYLTSEVLNDLGITIPVNFFTNSMDLLDFLSQVEKPSLILLDDSSTPDDGIRY